MIQRDKIRALNDCLRARFTGGRVMMTAAVAAMSAEDQARLLQAVRTFNRFNSDNDPHGEHDMAFIDLVERFFFKIDYYDREMEHGSEDPSDPEQTCRVMTIGRASDY